MTEQQIARVEVAAAVPSVSKEIEKYLEKPKREKKQTSRAVGRAGLEGFTIMEAVASPWQDVREGLETRIVNQPEAIDAIVKALEGSLARRPSDKRPIASLAFLGPTGVGKSETAKSLPEIIGYSDKLVRIDCSDYSHGHEVATLTGSPRGYIGYNEESPISKETIEDFGTVVLFDEIEKGSEPLYNLMLQIMEEGELQLKNGEIVSFREAIIILTSNLGAQEMVDVGNTSLGFVNRHEQTSTDRIDSVAKEHFKKHFRPEFINRLTGMVVFHPLDRDGLGQVMDTKLELANEDYEKILGAKVSISDVVREYLLDSVSGELHNGARPLVRSLDSNIFNTLGRYMWSGINPGTHIKVFHRSEVGGCGQENDTELVFASKHDDTIRRGKMNEPFVLATGKHMGLNEEYMADPDEGEE